MAHRSPQPGEGGCLLQFDGPDERIGVAMYKLPVGAVAAVDLSHAQRPLLVGIAPDVRVCQLQARLAGLRLG